MKAADWFTIFKVSFGIGGVLFVASVLAALIDRSGGVYRDFGLVGLLASTFTFITAYVSYQRFKIESKVEK